MAVPLYLVTSSSSCEPGLEGLRNRLKAPSVRFELNTIALPSGENDGSKSRAGSTVSRVHALSVRAASITQISTFHGSPGGSVNRETSTCWSSLLRLTLL